MLDPAPRVALLPVTCIRPKKKGDRIGPERNGKTPVAKTGHCSFSTFEHVPSKNANRHLEFLLEIVSDRIMEIRSLVSKNSLEWEAVFFDGMKEEALLSDLDPELLRRAHALGLLVIAKGREAVTIDWGPSGPPPRIE